MDRRVVLIALALMVFLGLISFAITLLTDDAFVADFIFRCVATLGFLSVMVTPFYLIFDFFGVGDSEPKLPPKL